MRGWLAAYLLKYLHRPRKDKYLRVDPTFSAPLALRFHFLTNNFATVCQVNSVLIFPLKMSTLHLHLRPHLSGKAEEDSIQVQATLPTPALTKGDVVFHHVLCRGPIKTQQYSPEDIRLLDNHGSPIELLSEDSKDKRQRAFHVGADVAAGEVTVNYEARPWNPTESSPCGPQIALERDAGGLTGAGMGFLLRPAETLGDLVDTVHVMWDLGDTPSGSHAVCSLGEGIDVVANVTPSVLDECFFAVGPLNSFPPTPTSPITDASERGGTLDSSGMYWLGNPNFDASALGQKMQQLFPKMAAFFHDDEKDPTYRIFLRRNVQKCVSGRGLHRGFVFAWNTVVPRDPDETDEFLMHETVHNWPRLGHSVGGPTAEEMVDAWFNEGIAEYYSLVLPYRFGILSEGEFLQRVNIRLSGYYTNPDRGVVNKDVMGLFWKGGHVNRIPYQRGLMYFLQLAYQLKKAGGRSLDDLILEMVDLRKRDEAHGIAVWLSLLERALGPCALEGYRSMSDATPIVLPTDYWQVVEGLHWKMIRQDQEEFCLGFSEESLGEKVVKELDPRSRAAGAGVQEGDAITAQYSYFFVAERWGQYFTMTVKKRLEGSNDGEEGLKGLKVLSWSPRSWHQVESYQAVCLNMIWTKTKKVITDGAVVL